MRLIAPHIRRAVLIGRMFEFKAAEVATFVDTLDGLSAGMYLVDANGRLIHANAAGQALLAASDILSFAAGGWSPAMRRSIGPCGTSLRPQGRATRPSAPRASPCR